MELSIIIVNYKSKEILKLCIRSLLKTIKSCKYEIIVIDSESDGETKDEILENFPKVAFFEYKKNLGYSKAVNEGIKKSSGKYLLILNPDIIAEKDAVDKMLAYIKSQNKAGVIGPRLLNFNGSTQQSAFRFYSPVTIPLRRTFLGRFGYGKKHLDKFLLKDKNILASDQPQKVDWLMGSSLLVSKKAADKVGGMDERFFMYFEDVDWAKRFWENGFEVIYFPKAKMHHYHRQASKKFGIIDAVFNKMTKEHIKSAYKYFKKHGIKTKHYV